MIIQPATFHKKPAIKIALSLSLVLGISACSDNTAVEDAPVSEPDVEVVAEPEVVEPAEEVAIVEADTAAEPEILAADAGVTLYESNCKACHASGLLNAPILGDKVAWEPRLTKGIETLSMHSSQGFNKMPAQAVNGVTEAQVHAAVEYMVAAVS